MSSTQDITQYSFNIYWADPNPALMAPDIAFSVSQNSGFGDTDAFALLDALVAALPAAWGARGSVSKNESSNTSYTTNYASTPPSFT